MIEDELYELALFAGAGGGLLASLLLGHTPVGYVEWNDYRQRIIAQRIADGILPDAPIFGDIRAFIRDGYAAAYTGLVDVVTAGFPCQPFSIAGNGAGADDERNMWPETAECIRIIRPRYCLLENVPGLLSHRYYGEILKDLASLGYDANWGVLSACALGAPHTRERLFILAYTDEKRCRGRSIGERSSASVGRRDPCKRAQGSPQTGSFFRPTLWDTTEADILGLDDGVGAKLERIAATGDGQVPAVVAAAWHLLRPGE